MRMLVVFEEELGLREVLNLDTVAKIEDFPVEERVCVTFVDRFESNFHGPGREAFVYALLRSSGMMLGEANLEGLFAGTSALDRWRKEKADLLKAIKEQPGGQFVAVPAGSEASDSGRMVQVPGRVPEVDPGPSDAPVSEDRGSISAQVGENIAAGGARVSGLRDEVSEAKVRVDGAGGASIELPETS